MNNAMAHIPNMEIFEASVKKNELFGSSKQDKKNRFKLFNSYLLIFSVLVCSSNASFLSKSDLFLFILVFYGTVLNVFNANSKRYVTKLFLVIIIISAVMLIYFFKNNAIDVYTWGGLSARLILAYNAVYYSKNKFGKYFSETIVSLGVVSLVFFIIQLVDYDLLFKSINLFGTESIRGAKPNSNILIFNLNPIHRIRNSGFMWEPGAFAAILVFGLLFSCKIDNNFGRSKAVLIVSILTTLSTMGYIALALVLILFYARLLKVYTLLIIAPLIFMFLNLDFLTSKINQQYNSIEDELLMTQFSGDQHIHLNRFASIYVDYNTFINNPWIGLGVDIYSTTGDLFYKEYDKNVVRTSGLMMVLVKIGSVGLLLFLYIMYKRLRTRYGSSGFAFLFCLVFLIVLFSNPIELSVVTLTFLFL